MSRRMWALAVSAWVVVVIAGSALTWVAIDRAGGRVTGSPTGDETQPAVVGTVGPAPVGTRTPRHRATGTPSTATTAPATPTAPHRTSSPAPAPTPSRTPSHSAATTQTRTWSGAAGTVTVTCTGRAVRLQGTSPGDAWSVEVGESEGGEVEVTFKRSESEVKVKASCVDGVPRFEVESGGGDGGESGDR